MKKNIFIVAFLFLLADIACAKEYKRIISLAPSVTESLYELGLEQFVKGITIYCSKGMIKKDTIGTLLEPDIEKITLLKPDIVISTKEGNNKETIEKLKRLGFEVYVMETAKNFNEICVNYSNLAEKLNKKREAKKIINNTRYSLEKIYSKLNRFNNLKVFWEVGARPLYTAGRQSFINDYNYYTNTVNIYKNVDKRYIFIDIENVIENDPDIILIVNVGDAKILEKRKWYKYQMIKAVKNNKIFIINSEDIFIPTPLTFVKNVTMLTKAVYGEVL
ncbi:MAG: helical backbone metal receptor [Endomicrobium sp.]|jgi:iron complex transport system substrate-binding protein|nr:helical backbone metal receptor [Endomicrobium sp.]